MGFPGGCRTRSWCATPPPEPNAELRSTMAHRAPIWTISARHRVVGATANKAPSKRCCAPSCVTSPGVSRWVTLHDANPHECQPAFKSGPRIQRQMTRSGDAASKSSRLLGTPRADAVPMTGPMLAAERPTETWVRSNTTLVSRHKCIRHSSRTMEFRLEARRPF